VPDIFVRQLEIGLLKINNLTMPEPDISVRC
jgi:hypothetical protein